MSWNQTRLLVVSGFIAWMLIAANSSCVAAESQDYSFKLGADKSEYILGEPVTLAVYVTNLTTGKKVIRSNFNLVGDLELRVTYGNELSRRAKSFFRPAIYPHVPLELAPYQTGKRTQILLYTGENECGYLFDRPGVYTLAGKLEYYEGDSSSPSEIRIAPIQIKISEPDMRAKEAIANLWNKDGAYDFNRYQATAKTAEAFKTVAENYSDTPYAPYALYSIARMKMSPIEATPESYLQAIELLKRLIQNYPNSSLVEDSYYLIIVAYFRMEESDMAAKYGKEMREKFPDVVINRGADPLIKKFVQITSKQPDQIKVNAVPPPEYPVPVPWEFRR